MEQTKNLVTVAQLAQRFKVSARRVHTWLKEGRTIPGIDSYRKMNPDNRNSPYLIEASKEFMDKRTKLAKPEPVDIEDDYLK